ncbi:MAG: BON domain-containing protein [Alphaproteobacteria bacterium]|nr:BON domain-containing protein [Alphaproteobacteria bacterium]
MISRRLFVVLSAAIALSACAVVEGRETAGQYLDDTTITTKVKAIMVDDPQVKASQVSVETMKGEVQLSGFVDSKASATRAEQIARSVQGVRAVRNDLVVR